MTAPTKRKFTLKRIEIWDCQDHEGDKDRKGYVWESEPFNRQGSQETVFCRADWFWANPNGRWMLENEAAGLDDDYPGFRSLTSTPVRPGATNDRYIT